MSAMCANMLRTFKFVAHDAGAWSYVCWILPAAAYSAHEMFRGSLLDVCTFMRYAQGPGLSLGIHGFHHCTEQAKQLDGNGPTVWH